MSDTPVYKPTPLNTLTDIAREMGVSKGRVKQWIRMGAPIGREGDGKHAVYFAELAKLQMWRERTFPAKDCDLCDDDGGDIAT